MPRQTVPVTKTERGGREVERHPAFGWAHVGRIMATPGQVLFQSDLKHREYIEVTVHEADRERSLKEDWVFPGRVICQFSMSMTQFASFAAGVGSSGVPVTIERTDSGERPGLEWEPRLAVTTAEVRAAADEAFAGIKEASAAYEKAVEDKVPAKERREAWKNLQATIGNAAPNVEYAGRKLLEHTEAVVERARADIEGMAQGGRLRSIYEGDLPEIEAAAPELEGGELWLRPFTAAT
jgi:hypothetical protein